MDENLHTRLKKEDIPYDDKVIAKELINVFENLFKDGLITEEEFQKATVIAHRKY